MFSPHDPCQCTSAGFCERYLTELDESKWSLCQEREDYRERFYDLSLDRIKLSEERAKEATRRRLENYSSSVAAIHLCNGLFDFLRSKFFKKEILALPIDISIKGLERSGTGFIHDLLDKNLLSSSLEQLEKHRFPADSNNSADRVILCVKNPYSWYLSFRDFGHSGRDLENARDYSSPSECIKLWNDFYRAWLNSGHNIFLLRYEDIIKDEPSYIKKISSHFGIRNTENYFEIKSYVNNYIGRSPEIWSGGFHRKEYFLSKDYIKDLSNECIISIRDTLDSNLLKKLGYSKEP